MSSNGQVTFAPGTNNMQGTFCYDFSPDTVGAQVTLYLLSAPACLVSGASPIIQPCSVAPECLSGVFADVPASDSYYNDIVALAARNLASGYSDGTFRPMSNITRGQLAKIIIGAFNLRLDTTGGPHFSDVPEGSAFYSYIETAFNRHIVTGYADGTFRPEEDVTRGQLAKMLVQAAAWTLVSPDKPTFSDVPAGTAFYTYIETATQHGALKGYGDGTFRPEREATREHVARVVVNILSIMDSGSRSH